MCPKCGCKVTKPTTDGMSCMVCGKWFPEEIAPVMPDIPKDVMCFCHEQGLYKTDYAPTVAREKKKKARQAAFVDSHFKAIRKLFADGYLITEIARKMKKVSKDAPPYMVLLKLYREKCEEF